MNADCLAGKKKEIAEAVRTLACGGILTLTVGHVSWRDSETGDIVILGHIHKENRFLDEVTEDDIIVMNSEGKVKEGRYDPPGELFIHTEIYKSRPEVKSVVHGHPDCCIAFSLHNRPLYPVYSRAAQFFPKVPVLDYAGQIDNAEKGLRCASALGSCTGLLLRGHGCITVGASIQDAAVNAFALETNARIMLQASTLGKIKPLNAEDLKVHKPTSVWAYYVRVFDPQAGNR